MKEHIILIVIHLRIILVGNTVSVRVACIRE